MAVEWTESDGLLRAVEPTGTVFEDTLDHWHNGVCRLLEVSDERAKRWVEAAAERAWAVFGAPLFQLGDEAACTALEQAAVDCFDPGGGPGLEPSALAGAPPVLGRAADTVWAPSVGGDETLAVIGSAPARLGWLVDARTLRPPPGRVAYDEAYFEGARPGVGYGAHRQQETWRMEKARRFLRQVEAVAGYLGATLSRPPRLLDVGAGYGFFRQAAQEGGWAHEGVEPSAFANRVSGELFGFSAHLGDLEGFAGRSHDRFDVVTMWDVLEHVRDPLSLVRAAHRLLLPGGLLFVRTPNLDALERDVFHARYHSFKAEHLHYFAAPALVEVLQQAGFAVGFLTSDSHLLQGFLGARLQGVARLLRGSDLFGAAVKGMTRAI